MHLCVMQMQHNLQNIHFYQEQFVFCSDGYTDLVEFNVDRLISYSQRHFYTACVCETSHRDIFTLCVCVCVCVCVCASHGFLSESRNIGGSCSFLCHTTHTHES